MLEPPQPRPSVPTRLLPGLLIGLAGLLACGSERLGPSGPGAGGLVPAATDDSDKDGLADAVEVALVEQFRPYWFVDASETARPIAVADWAALGGFAVGGAESLAYSDLASLAAAVESLRRGVLHLPPGRVAGRPGGAPVYVDAVPMPAGYAIDGRTDLVWLHYWLLYGDDVKGYAPSRSHRGDWEHVCAMVERSAAGERGRAPVRLHWHHHGAADIATTAAAWHADADGTRHPRAWIEAGGHGIYRSAGNFPGPHDDGAGSTDDPLDDPLVFVNWKRGQAGAAADEAAILRRFKGWWGQTANRSATSPRGPFQKNGACDHDYTTKPTATSFALGGCGGI